MKLNLNLLKRLYLIDHPSGNEGTMISFILNYCYKIPHLTFEIDDEKNLFITKNTTNPDSYACVVAHTDGVNEFYTNRELVLNENILSARYIPTKLQCGLNADDSNGICCALQLLEIFPNLKVLFTSQEEIGGTGATTACENYLFFTDVRYCIQADRRGKSDLIVHTNGIESADSKFVEDISDLMETYGYSENTGTFTDIGIIAEKLQISGVNISCGYYNEHFPTEVCNIDELQNCLNFMYSIVKKLDNNKYYTVPVQKKYSFNNTSSISSNYSFGFSPDEDMPCDKCINQDCMNCKYL